MGFQTIRYKLGVISVILALLFNLNTLIVNTMLSSVQYAVIFSLIYCIIFLCAWGKRCFLNNDKWLPFFIISLFFIVLSSCLNLDLHVLHFVIILEISKAIIISKLLTKYEFVEVYILTITFMAAVSLFFYFGLMLFPALNGLSHTINNNGYILQSFYVYFRGSTEIFRNFGYLSEPGDYQHYLNIALLLNLFVFENIKLKKIIAILLTITIITTFSPVGLSFMVLIWAAYIISCSKKPLKSTFILLVAIAVGLYIYHSSYLNYSINKLSNTETGSFYVRTIGIFSGFDAFLQNPLFGCGFTKATELMTISFKNSGLLYNQTSTVSAFLAFFGLPAALWFLLPYMYFFYSEIRMSFIAKFFVLSGLFFSINNERLVWDLSYYLFVVYGFVSNKNSTLFSRLEKSSRNGAYVQPS